MSGFFTQMKNKQLPNWRVRLWLLKNVFDRPCGRTVYRLLQSRSPFHTSPERFEKKRDQVLYLVDVAERAGTRIEGATIVEIGTGWVPLLPFVVWLLGAKKTYTIDLNRHLLRPASRRILHWLVNDKSSMNQLRARCDSNLFNERAEHLRHIQDPLSLLDSAEIVYHAPADARRLDLPDNSVDLVCSNVTFEHIPADVLHEIFIETARILKPEGRAVHRVDPSDHCAHFDRSISRVNFLRYTDDEWQRMAGQGIAYHNRLRIPEYKSLMQAAPLDIELFDSQIDQRALEDLKRFSLAERRWTQNSSEDLARQTLTLVARPSKMAVTPAMEPQDEICPSTSSCAVAKSVTLVIPGRNCASTLDRCLSSVVPLKESGQLSEIIFVNDGSTDVTAEIASRYPVRVLTGTGQGPGAARNLGWQAADTELIWFIDSDCVAEPDALEKLLPHMSEPQVAGVGGSYNNLYPDSLIATLIHEEIVARHRAMEREVDFLATFNVVYRRNVLDATGGFDESLKLAQDAELAYRIRACGHQLHFELTSRVGHHHPRHFWRYLKTQSRQGYYRVKLYRQHPSKISGDSYAGLLDYLQPPIGLLILACLPTSVFTAGAVLSGALVCLLLVLQVPMTWRLVKQQNWDMLHFLWFGSIRAIIRGVGMAIGTIQPSLPFFRSTEQASGASATSQTGLTVSIGRESGK